MIRLGESLRLTRSELGAFFRMIGARKAPATVAEHNAALESAAAAWQAEDDSAASRLVQAVLLAERIPQE